jgi:hypothetical protein
MLPYNKGGVYMVKGISRQVILVPNPDPKLFEQAIFILKDEAVLQGVTDEQLLKEAKRLMRSPGKTPKPGLLSRGPVWAAMGAALTGAIWLFTACVF